MFTEEEIQFLKQLWEECGEGLGWEPQFGDWAVDRHNGDIIIILAQTGERGHFIEFVPLSWEGYEEGQIHTGLLKNFIPLFTEGQLIKMLEEGGYIRWQMTNTPPDPCAIEIDAGFFEGSTPIIALGRALIEVMEKEER